MRHLSQNPTDPEFVQNPYAFYDRAREGGAFFFWEDYDMVCATSFAAVDAALRSRKLGREVPPEFRGNTPERIRPFMDFESRSLLELEPPAHTRLRAPITRAFTSRRINAFGPEITALAHQLIDAFPDQPFDLLPAFAEKIPVIIIARLLGVPEDMADQFLAWSHDMVAMYQANRSSETEDKAVSATLAFSDYMRNHIAHRRAHPGDDLISTLIEAEQSGAGLTTDEVITTAILLLNAGHEATVHAIGNGVRALLLGRQHPVADLMAPDRVAACVEETLRYDPPLHMFSRHVYQTVVIAGQEFERGDQIGLLLAAANRDPAIWDQPNKFDPARAIRANTSFGAGIHFCIGAPLARLELTSALPVLFARCPGLCLAEMPVYADRYHFHGLERLMVSR